MGAAVAPVVGAVANKYLNKNEGGKDVSRSLFEGGDLQRYVPPALRQDVTGPTITSGIQGIGELIRRPGGLAPNVAEAINPRLAAESQNIAQNFRGIASNQAGAAARGNLPVSLKNALQAALDVAQERAQRGARGAALSESEGLRREDTSRVFSILDAILQFTQAGRGTATAGLAANAASRQQSQAATSALVGQLLQSMAQYNASKDKV
jgi:hypothetical protein